MTDAIAGAILDRTELMRRAGDFVLAHPELGHRERRCAAYLAEVFAGLGLAVERPFGDLETAFTATLQGAEPGPRIGIALLYDAVPTVTEDGAYAPNHACGHNVISGAVVGAMAALADLSPRGSVVVMGLPGDEIGAPRVMEIGGGKALTAATGAWDDFDAVLYAHPEFENAVSRRSRWMERYCVALHHPRRYRQRGETRGSVPWAVAALLDGIRAFEESDGQEFVMIKDLRLDGDVEDGCRISARLRVLLFGLDKADLARRAERFEAVVGAVGADAGLSIDCGRVGAPTMGVKANEALIAVVHEAMTAAGLAVTSDPEPLPFATDFGNISWRAPGALIGIGRQGGWKFHAPEGARDFAGEAGHEAMRIMAEVLVRAVLRLWVDDDALDRVRADFQMTRSRASRRGAAGGTTREHDTTDGPIGGEGNSRQPRR